VFLVRKLGLPQHPELAMGAIASGGIMVLDRDLVSRLRVSDAQVERVVQAERRELERRERTYRGDRPLPDIADRTVILVDDGLATGATMRAAIEAVRQEGPRRVVVAVPVASPDACDAFRDVADDTVCAVTPEPFHSVGLWYDDFSQTTDDEVHDLLARARARVEARAAR
jgi:putative phosphoribosyl transferase